MDRQHGTWLWILIPKLMIGPPLAFDPPYHGIFPPRWCWLRDPTLAGWRDPGFGEKSPFLMVESRRIPSFCMVIRWPGLTWLNTQLLNFWWSRPFPFFVCWNHHRAPKTTSAPHWMPIRTQLLGCFLVFSQVLQIFSGDSPYDYDMGSSQCKQFQLPEMDKQNQCIYIYTYVYTHIYIYIYTNYFQSKQQHQQYVFISLTRKYMGFQQTSMGI